MRIARFLSVAALVAAPAFAVEPSHVPIDEDRGRAVQCLATAIAYEAGFESVEGQQAVAEVILNRLRNPNFPKTVCGVVFAGSERRTGCQFSFTCDGSLKRRLPDTVLARTRSVAEAAIDGINPMRAPGATHYHADYVSPYWAPSLVRVMKIGAHIFYRLPALVDQGSIMRAYRPVGEPLIDALGPMSRSTSGSIAQPDASASATFAPWGLAP